MVSLMGLGLVALKLAQVERKKRDCSGRNLEQLGKHLANQEVVKRFHWVLWG
jgi:hypothetical protein